MTEDEMVGWYHRLNGHEFEQTPGDSEGQGGLGYCSPWGCKESDMTQQLKTSAIEIVLQSPGTTATQPTHCIYGSPCPLESVVCNKRSHTNETLYTTAREWPLLTADREKPTQQPRPSTAKRNKLIKLFLKK